MEGEDDDEEFLYGPTEKKPKLEDAAAGAEPDSNRQEIKQEGHAQPETKQEGDLASESESEDESESDLEVIIDAKPGQRVEPPKGSGFSNIRTQTGDRQPLIKTEAKPPAPELPGVDIDHVAEVDGKKIYDMDLEEMENKPWRQPGADVSDYFNYGFDEFTWTAYSSKQSTLRQDYNPQKFMSDMMSQMSQISGGADMMMPPEMQAMMGGGGMPPGMPGMPQFNPEMMMQMGMQPPDFNSMMASQMQQNKGTPNFGNQGFGAQSNQGYGGQSNQGYGGQSNQGYGGQSNQSNYVPNQRQGSSTPQPPGTSRTSYRARGR